MRLSNLKTPYMYMYKMSADEQEPTPVSEENSLNAVKVKLFINKILCFDNGTPTDASSKRLARSMKKNNIEITLDLNSGKAMQTIYFSDLSHEYVHINSAYTT